MPSTVARQNRTKLWHIAAHLASRCIHYSEVELLLAGAQGREQVKESRLHLAAPLRRGSWPVYLQAASGLQVGTGALLRHIFG